ncbi:phage-like element PBSX protein XkdJ [Bacillus safensis]|uniref:Phage-like element PBSX protein XkdJ n=1 Tax=Bacillus safensis TaxID=561879 RepID=A0A5S9MEE3_BACIA|nr:phage-like element PBSX protein XkdJ [Bacillus safensis]
MNQEVGAIMHYIYTHFPVTMYDRLLPERFQVPSVYVPPVTVISDQWSRYGLYLYEILFAASESLFILIQKKTHDAAESIVDALLADRQIIQMMSEDGEVLDDYVRIKRVETRMIDQGVAAIVLTWDSSYWYNRDKQASLEDINFSDGVIKREQD